MIVDRKKLIELSGLTYNSVMVKLKAAGIDNDADFYDVFVLRYLKRERVAPGTYRNESEEERKARNNGYVRKHREQERERKRAPSRLYKVSVLDEKGRWIVKAVCLSWSEGRDMSAELRAAGIKARFRPHSYGIKPRQTHED